MARKTAFPSSSICGFACRVLVSIPYRISSSIKIFKDSCSCWTIPDIVSSARFRNEERNFVSVALGAAPSSNSSTSSLASRDSISFTSSDRLCIFFCLYKPTNSPVKSERPDCFQNWSVSFADMGIRLFAISSIVSRISWSVTRPPLWFRRYNASHPHFPRSWKSMMTTSSTSIRRLFRQSSPLMST